MHCLTGPGPETVHDAATGEHPSGYHCKDHGPAVRAVFCTGPQAQRRSGDGYPGRQPIAPCPRDGRPVPAHLRGVRRRAMPDRARLRGRCHVALRAADAAPRAAPSRPRLPRKPRPSKRLPLPGGRRAPRHHRRAGRSGGSDGSNACSRTRRRRGRATWCSRPAAAPAMSSPSSTTASCRWPSR